MKNLQELFVDQLKDVHSAERQLVRALPRMAKAATAARLRKAFEDHLAVGSGGGARPIAGLAPAYASFPPSCPPVIGITAHRATPIQFLPEPRPFNPLLALHPATSSLIS